MTFIYQNYAMMHEIELRMHPSGWWIQTHKTLFFQAEYQPRLGLNIKLRILCCVCIFRTKMHLFMSVCLHHSGVNVTHAQMFYPCDLSMTRSVLTGWGCLLSHLPGSFSGWARRRTPSSCWEGGSWRNRKPLWTQFWSTTDSQYKFEFIVKWIMNHVKLFNAPISNWISCGFVFTDLLNGENQSQFLTQFMVMQRYPTMTLSMWLEGRAKTSEHKVWLSICCTK